MKKNIILIIASFLIFSCEKEEKNSSLEELYKQKSDLLTKIDSLKTNLKTIEHEISKLDKSKKIQLVSIIPVENKLFKHFIEIQGVVKSDKNIELKPELGGTVKNIFVKEGERVLKGQTLIQLDDALIKNNIAELNTQLTLAKTTFERQKRLWNQKIGSEMQYLQAKTQKESLEKNLLSLRTQANKMKVIAPFTGFVDEVIPKKGELTNPQLPVIRLINLNRVYVEADVTETYLPVIKIGTEAIVNFPSINKEQISKISQIGNFINPENRSFKTKINLSNKDKLLKPNLLADLKILDFKSKGTVIPSTLIQQDQQGNNYVFSIKTTNNEHKVIKKIISLGKEYNHEVFITSGLSENDSLVSTGARLVKAGDFVKINN